MPACAVAAACETGDSARRDSHRLQVGDTVYAVPASARPALDDGPVSSDDRVIVTQRFSFALTDPVRKPGGHSVHTIASPAIVSPDLRPGIPPFAAAAVRRLAYSAIAIDRPNRSAAFEIAVQLTDGATRTLPARCQWATDAPGNERAALMNCEVRMPLADGNILVVGATPPLNDRSYVGDHVLQALRDAERFSIQKDER